MRRMRATRWQLLAALLAVVAGLGLTATVPAPPATVADLSTVAPASHINFSIPPGADLISSSAFAKPDGVVLGHLYVYDDNGDKYAKLVPVPVLQGTARYLLAFIQKEGGNGYINCHTTVQCDDGNYAYYAGPVRRINLSGQCIDSLTSIEYPVGGTTYTWTRESWACD